MFYKIIRKEEKLKVVEKKSKKGRSVEILINKRLKAETEEDRMTYKQEY
jgi:hypothetical protein